MNFRQNACENWRELVISAILGLPLGLFLAFFLSAIYYNFLVFQVINSFILLFFSIISGLILVSYLYYKRNLRNSVIVVILFIATVWFVLQLSVIGSVEYQYQNMVEDYKHEYVDAIDTGQSTPLSTSWLLAERYHDEMVNTYGQNGILLPNRAISDTPIGSLLLGANPILWTYFGDFNSRNKLIFLQKTGNCGEYAGAIALMIRDVSGMNTRVIQMEGADHGLPEVYYEGDWWVFDKTYTTLNSPIKARNYATYLRDANTDLYLSIADLKVAPLGESALEGHGFSASNVTISALFDTIRNEEPNTPLANTDIEVYAVKYQRDPLVFTGKTDTNGDCNLVLNGDKEYIILGSNGVHKGIKSVNVLPSEDESITLLLY